MIKEVRATFSARPGSGNAAAPCRERRSTNFFLAGDWTRSGWPATMEGAVRSGYHGGGGGTARGGKRRGDFFFPISHDEAMRRSLRVIVAGTRFSC